MVKTIAKDDAGKSKQTDEGKTNEEGLIELKKKNEELEVQVKRLLADYQNLEKRTHGEREEIIKLANKRLLLHLLPALDTLMLAGKHIQDEGLRLSIEQFQDALSQEGIEKIKTIGETFDPHLMECFETSEGEEGKVVEEIQTGYTLFENVLRPARVKVGKKVKETNQEEKAKEELLKGDYL